MISSPQQKPTRVSFEPVSPLLPGTVALWRQVTSTAPRYLIHLSYGSSHLERDGRVLSFSGLYATMLRLWV
jgi:hypothetical protein